METSLAARPLGRQHGALGQRLLLEASPPWIAVIAITCSASGPLRATRFDGGTRGCAKAPEDPGHSIRSSGRASRNEYRRHPVAPRPSRSAVFAYSAPTTYRLSVITPPVTQCRAGWLEGHRTAGRDGAGAARASMFRARNEVGVNPAAPDILCEQRSAGRWFRRREIYPFWREAWARPVEESEHS